MKSLALLSVFLALPVFAQTTATTPVTPVATATGLSGASLPTYVMAGTSFNQIGSPRWNLIAGAIYPTGSSTLEYTSTTVNVIPIVTTNNGKKFYTFETTAQQSVHKILYNSGKFVLLLGGGLGASFSQASPSGTNVTLAASFTATPAYQINAHWWLAFPIQGIYTNQGWDLVPAAAVVFKP